MAVLVCVCVKFDRDRRNITSGHILHDVGYKFDRNFISTTGEPRMATILLAEQGTVVF